MIQNYVVFKVGRHSVLKMGNRQSWCIRGDVKNFKIKPSESAKDISKITITVTGSDDVLEDKVDDKVVMEDVKEMQVNVSLLHNILRINY